VLLKYKPIGFFDSGVGGISVLKEAVAFLPYENFIYFGDSKNAPYGVKSVKEVKELTFRAVEFLLNKDVKAVVVACNTATSAAIEDLRVNYRECPIIGIEPALKPAVELEKKGKIIIMATPMTLAENKFKRLMIKYSAEHDIEPLPCPGLVELIENGILEGERVEEYLRNKLKPFENSEVAAVVLGCTHYPFVKSSIKAVLKDDASIIDGSAGTVKQLKRQLTKFNLLNDSGHIGDVEILNSKNDKDIIDLSYKLLKLI
jgi:glutamate racemase